MPSSAQAALVFLVVVVPGFVAIAGYRRGRAAPEYPEGLVAAARTITVSAIIALVAWRLGGREVYEHARAGTALRSNESNTFRFAVALLVLPGLAGFVLGELTDWSAQRVARAGDGLPPRSSDAEGLSLRMKRKLLEVLAVRLLHEGPTTWDRAWKHLRRSEPFVYVRIRTKSGEEIIATVADRSRIAVSPQPRDLYVEEILRQAEDGRYYPTAHGLGAFVMGSEIESVEWVSHKGLYRPEAQDG
jgi:hypothetical protein